MPDYLVSGTDAKGKRVVKRITATTAGQAAMLMQRRGFVDVELHTDDLAAALQSTGNVRKRIREHVPPALELGAGRSSPLGVYLHLVASIYRSTGLLILITLGLLAWQHARGQARTSVDWIVIGLILIPLVIPLVALRNSRAIRRLEQLAVAGQWENVLPLAARLERRCSRSRQVPPFIFTFWRARALAGLGRLDQALAVAAESTAMAPISPAAYQTQLATVFAAANREESALGCHRKAAELAPNEPAGWLGLAEILAVRLERPEEARAALEQLRRFPLADQTRSGLDLIEGAIALCEGRYTEACAPLETFRDAMIKTAPARPLAIAAQRTSEALLAIAYARRGDRATALSYYRAAAPFLRRHRDERLLRRCQAVLPGATLEEGP